MVSAVELAAPVMFPPNVLPRDGLTPRYRGRRATASPRPRILGSPIPPCQVVLTTGIGVHG